MEWVPAHMTMQLPLMVAANNWFLVSGQCHFIEFFATMPTKPWWERKRMARIPTNQLCCHIIGCHFDKASFLCKHYGGVMSKFLWHHMHDPLCGSWICCHRVHSCHCTISWKENDKHAFLHWVDVVVSNTSFASDIMQVQCHQSWCLPTLVMKFFLDVQEIAPAVCGGEIWSSWQWPWLICLGFAHGATLAHHPSSELT